MELELDGAVRRAVDEFGRIDIVCANAKMDVTNGITWLTSISAQWVTGECLPVDGGLPLR